MKYGLGRLWWWWWWWGGGGGGGRGLFLCRTLQQPRKLLSAWTFMFHQLHRFTSGKKKKVTPWQLLQTRLECKAPKHKWKANCQYYTLDKPKGKSTLQCQCDAEDIKSKLSTLVVRSGRFVSLFYNHKVSTSIPSICQNSECSSKCAF